MELIEGSSTDPAVVATLRERAEGRRVMVDLDSDHRAEHVGELRITGHPQCYLVVEDTWFGRTVRFDQGPGPAEALDAWLAEGQPFEVDRWRERLLLTGMAGGYLRRVGAKGAGAPGPPRLDRFFVPRLDADPDARKGDHQEEELTAEQVARNRHQAVVRRASSVCPTSRVRARTASRARRSAGNSVCRRGKRLLRPFEYLGALMIGLADEDSTTTGRRASRTTHRLPDFTSPTRSSSRGSSGSGPRLVADVAAEDVDAPGKLVDSGQDPEDLLGFLPPRTWQGTVDAIPVDTTFVSNHLLPLAGSADYTTYLIPITFSAALLHWNGATTSSRPSTRTPGVPRCVA